MAFGVTSSPFLLRAVIDFHLKKYSEGSEETTECTRSTTEKLRKSLYVDNCVTSVEEIPGRDGEVRLVKLRTASGFLLRPIQRVYPLEMMKNRPNLTNLQWGLHKKQRQLLTL